MRRLRVGVNLLWLVPGVVGGSEEYTTRLLAALHDAAPDDLEMTLFVVRPFVEAYPELVASYRTVVAPVSGSSRPMRIAAEATWLAAQALARRLDLVHHAGGTIPLLRATPAMLTIHDLQPLLYPDNFTRTKQAYLRRRLRPSALKARLVVTLTDYTRRTIVEHLGVPEERTALVPPGYSVSHVDEPNGDPRSDYDIDGPFFLYPAITYAHKNHTVLVAAFAEVVRERPDALLVLTGGPAEMEAELADQAIALGIERRIRRLGRIPRGDLTWLYRNATALTFPSRFEGFGLPVLEAMGHGCPVIAAAAASLPEVVGDSGILLSPDDPGAWADAMLDLLGDDAKREWLGEAGLARTATFRWTTSAECLHAAFLRAAEATS